LYGVTTNRDELLADAVIFHALRYDLKAEIVGQVDRRGHNSSVSRVGIQVHDEGLVDLHLSNGKTPHSVQRGGPDPEVVDGEAHTEASELLKDFDVVPDFASQPRRFSDLESQKLGWKLMHRQDPTNLRDEIGIVDLGGRDVYGHFGDKASLLPFCTLGDCALEHPGGQRRHQTRRFGGRDGSSEAVPRPPRGVRVQD
jgi:hypothetical protein